MTAKAQCSRCKLTVTFVDASKVSGRRCAACGGALRVVDQVVSAGTGAGLGAPVDGAWTAGRGVRRNLQWWFFAVVALALVLGVIVTFLATGGEGPSEEAVQGGKLVRTSRVAPAAEVVQTRPEGRTSPVSVPSPGVPSEAVGSEATAPEPARLDRVYPLGPLPPDLAAKVLDVVTAFAESKMDLMVTGAKSVRAGSAIDVTVGGQRYQGIAYRAFGVFVLKPGQFSVTEFYVATTADWHLTEAIVLPPETYISLRDNRCDVVDVTAAGARAYVGEVLLVLSNRSRIVVHLTLESRSPGAKKTEHKILGRQSMNLQLPKGAYVVRWQANWPGGFSSGKEKRLILRSQKWVFESSSKGVTRDVRDIQRRQ